VALATATHTGEKGGCYNAVEVFQFALQACATGALAMSVLARVSIRVKAEKDRRASPGFRGLVRHAVQALLLKSRRIPWTTAANHHIGGK
jgi:hypothetical protein